MIFEFKKLVVSNRRSRFTIWPAKSANRIRTTAASTFTSANSNKQSSSPSSYKSRRSEQSLVLRTNQTNSWLRLKQWILWPAAPSAIVRTAAKSFHTAKSAHEIRSSTKATFFLRFVQYWFNLHFLLIKFFD